MTQTKPSREALSAAKIIARERVELTIEAAAHIIDSKTNHSELLEAAKALLPHIWEDNLREQVESDFERAVVKLEQAIAKAAQA